MNDQELDQILASYRAAVPATDPSPQFMPRLWEVIEARQTFRIRFGRLSRMFVTAAGAIWLLMGTLLIFGSAAPARTGSDFDVLADSHAPEAINLDIAAPPGSDTK